MQQRLENAVVVITGAASGIGRAAALEFARHKSAVVVTARRERPLEEVAQECRRLGGRAMAVPVDVTDEAAMRALARHVVDAYGSIDVWVNNAAVTVFGRLEEVPYEALRRVIDTNLFGYIHGARAAIPYFREQGRGVLINVTSAVGKVGEPFLTAYASSKFAITGLAESLRMELRDTPTIHVCNLIAPSVDTPLLRHAANYTGRAVTAIPPVFPAERIASAIVHLAIHPRSEVAVGVSNHMSMAMKNLVPPIAERMVASQVEKKQFENAPAKSTEGNLFMPMDEWNTVSGGFGRANSGHRRAIGFGLAVLGISLGTGLGMLSKQLSRAA